MKRKIDSDTAIKIAEFLNANIAEMLSDVEKQESYPEFILTHNEQRLITNLRSLSKEKKDFYLNSVYESSINGE